MYMGRYSSVGKFPTGLKVTKHSRNFSKEVHPEVGSAGGF